MIPASAPQTVIQKHVATGARFPIRATAAAKCHSYEARRLRGGVAVRPEVATEAAWSGQRRHPAAKQSWVTPVLSMYQYTRCCNIHAHIRCSVSIHADMTCCVNIHAYIGCAVHIQI